MTRNKEYFVFISYSSLDNEWAIWLRQAIDKEIIRYIPWFMKMANKK